MELLSVPRVIISGVSTGVGKSLISLGLTMELRKRGINVSCAVTGLNHWQSTIQRRILGRNVITLDPGLLGAAELLTSTYLASIGSDLLLIEGRAGVFDGDFEQGADAGLSAQGSDGAIASLIKSPVVLVVDGAKLCSSLAPIVKGFLDYATGFPLLGVIVNRVPGASTQIAERRELYRKLLTGSGLPNLLGVMPELESVPELMPAGIYQRQNSNALPRQLLVKLGNLVATHLDVALLVDLAQQAEYLRLEELSYGPFPRRSRIAVSDDPAFNIGFQDNLEYLRYFGAEIVPFSPLADTHLPVKIGAIYLTSAYLSEYGAEISANSAIREAIKNFADSGGVVFAEGAGVAYLSSDFSAEGGSSTLGVGLFEGRSRSAPYNLAYQDLVTVDDSILGPAGTRAKAISTGEWSISCSDRVPRVVRVTQGANGPYLEGFSPGAQIFLTNSLIHFGSNPDLARSLVDAASVVAPIS